MKNLILIFVLYCFFSNNLSAQDYSPFVKQWVENKQVRKYSINNQKKGLIQGSINSNAILAGVGDTGIELQLLFYTKEGNNHKLETVTISNSDKITYYTILNFEQSNIKSTKQNAEGVSIYFKNQVKEIVYDATDYYAERTLESRYFICSNKEIASKILTTIGNIAGKPELKVAYTAPDGKKFEIYHSLYQNDYNVDYYQGFEGENFEFYKVTRASTYSREIEEFEYISVPTKNIKTDGLKLVHKDLHTFLEIPISKSATKYTSKEGKTSKNDIKGSFMMPNERDYYNLVEKDWYAKFNDSQKKAFDSQKNVREKEVLALKAFKKEENTKIEYEAQKLRLEEKKKQEEAEENGGNNNNNSTNSHKSSKNETKKEEKTSNNSASTKKELIDIKIKNDQKDGSVTIYNQNRGGSYNIQRGITTTIKCYVGDKLFDYEGQKKGRLLFVVQENMDGKVQLFTKF